MFRFAIALAVGCILRAGCAVADEPGRGSLSWLKFDAYYSTVADKAEAYVGDGDDVEAVDFLGGRGMSAIIMLKNHTYMAGQVTSHDGKLLIIKCRVTNASGTKQTFHPLDVGMNWSPKALLAFGYGGFAFAKEANTWEKLRKTETWNLSPQQQGILSYVFALPKDASAYQLTYEGAQLAELHPKKNQQ